MSLPAPSPEAAAAPAAAPAAAAEVPRLAPDAAVRLSRAVAVASLLALIALGLAWELWLAPTGRGTLALKVLPLAWPLAGLLKYRMPTYRRLSLFIWLYVVEGAVRGASDGGLSARLAWGQVALCLLLFCACAVQVRWRLQRVKAA